MYSYEVPSFNEILTTISQGYDPELYAGHFHRPFADLVIFSQEAKRGEGSFGNTYRGTLSGSPVAVKVLKKGELYTEVGLLGYVLIHHVSFLLISW